MAINAASYDGNAFADKTALPPLFGKQIAASADGSNLQIVADKLRRDGGEFIWLTPEKSAKDFVVDAVRSEPELRRMFGTTMRKQLVGGPYQGHANPQKNIEGYVVALLP
ncbi:MAG: hypothetical protein H0W89_05445 [Candidatus Levybacteria bacterium]|nr:hypothetical protein [Candidatus Levybacteria bacterium]